MVSGQWEEHGCPWKGDPLSSTYRQLILDNPKQCPCESDYTLKHSNIYSISHGL